MYPVRLLELQDHLRTGPCLAELAHLTVWRDLPTVPQEEAEDRSSTESRPYPRKSPRGIFLVRRQADVTVVCWEHGTQYLAGTLRPYTNYRVTEIWLRFLNLVRLPSVHGYGSDSVE